MKRMFNMQWRVLLLLFVTLACSSIAFATDHPFTDVGTVDQFYENKLVLGDEIFSFSDATQVRTETGLSIPLTDLAIGDKVGFNLISVGQNAYFVTEIWKLSETFNLDGFYHND